MAINVKTDEKFAVKVIRFDKQQSITRGAMMLEIEYSRMKIFDDHPNIIKSYYWDSNGVLEMNGDCMGVMYNVIEFAENGSLANIIRYTGGLGEEIAKFYFTQIWHAVNYIHFLWSCSYGHQTWKHIILKYLPN